MCYKYKKKEKKIVIPCNKIFHANLHFKFSIVFLKKCLMAKFCPKKSGRTNSSSNYQLFYNIINSVVIRKLTFSLLLLFVLKLGHIPGCAEKAFWEIMCCGNNVLSKNAYLRKSFYPFCQNTQGIPSRKHFVQEGLFIQNIFS